jgi:uncharacterized repeat protein (TIGR01451 family)
LSNRLVRVLAVLVVLAVAGLAFVRLIRSDAVRATEASGQIYLTSPVSAAAHYAGSEAEAAALEAGQATPLSMAVADVDGDGVADLIAGYGTAGGGALAVYRGNLDAFAPQSSESFAGIAQNRFPFPFLPEARAITSPVKPDFLVTGRFTGSGRTELAIAARGGTAIYVLAQDETGSFTAVQTLPVSGQITALDAHAAGVTGGFAQVLVGLHDTEGARLEAYSGSADGLTRIQTHPLAGDAKGFAFGEFDGDSVPDAAILAGGEALLLRGVDLQNPDADGAALTSLSGSFRAVALAAGSFLRDRANIRQLALLAADGSVHIFAQANIDSQPLTKVEALARRSTMSRRGGIPIDRRAGVAMASRAAGTATPDTNWKEVESYPGVVTLGPSGQVPFLLRTRISGYSADDVVVLDPATGVLAMIAHPNGDGTTQSAGVVVRRQDSIQGAVAALPARVNIDGRPGLLLLQPAQPYVAVLMPLPDPVFVVNRTDDPVPGAVGSICNGGASSCSLREAVIKANATAGVDTIQVPAGTYTLTRTGADENAAATGDLDITDGVNVVGAVDGSGNPATIVQAGPGVGTGIDKVFSINPFIPANGVAGPGFDASLANLTIRYGKNPSPIYGDGMGGGLDWDNGTDGTGSLAITNCVITDNTTTDGDGGGIAAFSSASGGTGALAIANSTIQNNSPVESSSGGSGIGGGIYSGFGVSLSLTNAQVLNNKAIQSNGQGGGLYITGYRVGAQPVIHGGAITGNQAGLDGGGIYTGQGIVIDQGAVISNNQAIGRDGGGIWSNLEASPGFPSGETTTISKVTITGNSAAGKGGGIHVDTASPGNNLVISWSRIAGNTAPTGSGLQNAAGAVTATNNWWGTNTPASAISGTVAYDPFIKLNNTASPATITIGNTSTVTASFLADNHGTAISLANLTVLIGLPITFGNAAHGSMSNAQTTIQSTGTATATFTATSGGAGGLDATVDAATVTAVITIPSPPTLAKAFGAASVPLNGTTSLTFTVTNPNSGLALTGIGFSDTLPANLLIATPNGVSNTCGGVVTAVAGAGLVTLSGGTVAASSACTLTVSVTGTSAGTAVNTSGTVTSTEGGAGNTASASLAVVAPPSMVKAFGAASISLNGTTSLTFTITNPSANTVAQSGVAFTDTLPSGLVVATPNGLSNTCGGTPTATAGSGSINLTGGSIAVNSSCTLAVNVTGTSSGQLTNTSGAVSSTNGGTGNTATASLSVASPPSIAKTFGAASIPLNGSTSLSFTVTNPATNTVSLAGVAFTDSLPAGLVVATPSGLTGSCGGGTITAVAGSGSVSLAGATLTANSSCTFSVNVTGTSTGVKNNSVSVTSTSGGNGNTSNASLTVVAAAGFSKAFGAVSVPLNGTTSLTFTVTNPNTSLGLTGVAFTDTLPANLVVATPNGVANTCSGSVTATPGTNVIALSGGTVAASATCTLTVNVTGTAAGAATNTSGAVSSNEGGTGGTASASLSVVSPPSMVKAFGASSISLNGTTTLTFTITNPSANTVAQSGVAFMDALPSGLVVATPNGLTDTCGGTPTAVAGSGSISLTGGTIAVNSSCAITVNVTGTASGQLTNTSGAVSSTNGGTGNTATASLSVASPPSIVKTFGAASIPLNGSTSLSFTVTNPAANTISLAGVAFTDSLPSGLVVATPSGLTGSCGGGTITAAPGSGSVSLSGATIAANSSCTFSVNVTGTSVGVKNNSVTVTSTTGGTGNTSNASVTVAAAAGLTKAFGAASVPVNGTTSLTFTVSNPNPSVGLTGVAFTDTLPANLVVATPNGVANTCSGAVTATPGANVIALSGGSAGASASCTLTVNVTGTAPGTANNTSGAVSSNEGGTGGTASASLAVVGPPSIAKAFGAASVTLNGTTTLTFTLMNPAANTVAQAGVAFIDTLPSGLVVASPNGLIDSCGGTATAAGGSISLTGGTIPVNGSCAITVNVTATASGQLTNVSGPVSSTNGGTGNTTTASLLVATPITFNTSPAGLTFSVDGVPYSTAQTLSLVPGSTHTIAVTSPQAGPAGTQYAFLNWSDSGAQSHSITVPATAATYTASFKTQYQLTTTTSPAAGGTVSPSGGFYDAGSTVNLTATPATGYLFDRWSANVTAVSGATGKVVMNAPETVQAMFRLPNLLTVNPPTAALSYTVGTSPSTLTQNFSVTAATPVSFTISSSVPWAKAPGTGPTPATVQATFDVSGLAPGTYPVNLTFTAPDGSVSVPVNVTVLGTAILVPTPSSVSVTAPAGSSTPITKPVVLTAQNQNATFTFTANQPWLKASSANSTTPATLNIQVNPTGLASGTYNGAVVVTSPGASNSPFSIPVTLVVAGGPPAPQIGGIANGASFQPGKAAPNTILSLFGVSLGCATTPQVLINGAATQVLWASDSQINVTALEAPSGATAAVQVVCNGNALAQTTIPAAAVAPGLFTVLQTGTGQGSILNQDLSPNNSANPEQRGRYLAVYGTGFGVLNAPSEDGLRHLAGTVTATIGGVEATIAYAGEAPGYTLGLQQINVLIPEGAPAGSSIPITLTANGTATQTGVTIAIE